MLKNKIAELENTPDGFDSMKQKRGSNTGHRNSPIRAEKKKKWKNSEARLKNLYDNIKQTNNCMIEVPEGEQRKKGAENLSEEITENFPNLRKENTSRYKKLREFLKR